MGEWGIINYYPSAKTDIQKDSYADISRKWSSAFTAWQSTPNKPVFYSNKSRMNKKIET
jgi:hypothetical protein